MRKASTEVRKPALAFADTGWINGLHLRRGVERISAAGVGIVDISISKRVKRNGPLHERSADDLGVVVIEKEEQLVAHNRASDITAELILYQMVPWDDGS